MAKVGLVNMVFLFTVLALTHVLPNIGPYAKSKYVNLPNIDTLSSSSLLSLIYYMMSLRQECSDLHGLPQVDRLAYGSCAFQLFQDICFANDGKKRPSNARKI